MQYVISNDAGIAMTMHTTMSWIEDDDDDEHEDDDQDDNDDLTLHVYFQVHRQNSSLLFAAPCTGLSLLTLVEIPYTEARYTITRTNALLAACGAPIPTIMNSTTDKLCVMQ